MKRLHSEIGRKQMADGTKTGTQLGELAATTGSNMAVAAMDEMRLARTAIETSQTLVTWLSNSCGITVQMRTNIAGNPEVTIGWTDQRRLDKLPVALEAVERLLNPTSGKQVGTWLVELAALAPTKADSELIAKTRFKALAARLSPYPADILHEVLLVHTWKWFPTWYELRGHLDRIVAPRRLLHTKLVSAISNANADVPEKPVNAPVSRPDDAQAIEEAVQYFRRGGKDAPPVETDEEFMQRIQSDKRRPRPETLRTIGRDTLIRANMNG